MNIKHLCLSKLSIGLDCMIVDNAIPLCDTPARAFTHANSHPACEPAGECGDSAWILPTAKRQRFKSPFSTSRYISKLTAIQMQLAQSRRYRFALAIYDYFEPFALDTCTQNGR
eukprot:TRINITY_DN12204_c0_g1_i3.p6 TRINITY_DN12204_c0_g1~~TRINITY_DN12204_c0_g1_i3.p6  ORF type:complete len:114 (-),score=4.93 TRINITY_DN12204_c0_g1_i3:2219-2560(-)